MNANSRHDDWRGWFGMGMNGRGVGQLGLEDATWKFLPTCSSVSSYQHTSASRLEACPHTNPFSWRTVCFSGRAPGPKRGGLVPNVMSATLGGASARRAAPAVHTLPWGALAASSFWVIMNHNSSHHGSASRSQFCFSHTCDLPHGCGKCPYASAPAAC